MINSYGTVLCSVAENGVMKKISEGLKYQLLLLFTVLMNASVALAQDGGGTGTGVSVTKTTTSSSSTWYMQPWAWIVGGIVLLIVIIALVSGGSRTDVHRTTIHKDIRTSD